MLNMIEHNRLVMVHFTTVSLLFVFVGIIMRFYDFNLFLNNVFVVFLYLVYRCTSKISKHFKYFV